jgi:hypothetical protein
MKRLTLSVCFLLVILLAALPLSAQGRGASGGANAGRGASTGSASSTASPGYSGSPASYSSYSGGSYSPDPIGNRGISSGSGYGYGSGSGYGSGNGSGYYGIPNLQGTSFCSYDYYSSWSNYYSYLFHYHNLNPTYFTRFYNNREPLMTPAMLKLTLRQPMFVSTEMLRMIDQLEMMLRDSKAGKAVNKEDIIAKSQAIRKMAKQIRQNPTLELIDIREDTDLYKDNNFDALSLESVAKLRETALDLNRQLTDMYSTSSSATISVQSYRQHSFDSMAKGIERVCKAIESSSKKL